MYTKEYIQFANKFEIFLARVFGKRYEMMVNEHIIMIAYYYRGRFYIVDEKKNAPEWKPRKTKEVLSRQVKQLEFKGMR